MSMTVVVTRNVSGRTRGFLASTMLEMAPGVYCAPNISAAVRNRTWDVLTDWFPAERDASIIILWQDSQAPGGMSVDVLGYPQIELKEVDGLVLSLRQRKGGPE